MDGRNERYEFMCVSAYINVNGRDVQNVNRWICKNPGYIMVYEVEVHILNSKFLIQS